jgi:hypothetical protein
LTAAVVTAVALARVALAGTPAATPQDRSCVPPLAAGPVVGAAEASTPGPIPPPPSEDAPVSRTTTRPPQAGAPAQSDQEVPVPDRPPAAPASRWPIEYVLRPQTLPKGTARVGVTSAVVVVDSPYHNLGQMGASATAGVTDRWEIGGGAPRLLCAATGTPSPCDGYARTSGTGAQVTYGALRTRALQLAVSSGMDIALSSPTTFAVWASGRTKWLVSGRVAAELELGLSRWLDPPAFYQREHGGVFGNGVADFNFQVTRHLLVWADLQAYAPLAHARSPAVEPSAGWSWTFETGTAIYAWARDYNVLSRSVWDMGIGAYAFGASVVFWAVEP